MFERWVYWWAMNKPTKRKYQWRPMAAILLAIALLVASCSIKQKETLAPADRTKILSAKEAKEDALWLVDLIEATHPEFLNYAEFEKYPREQYSAIKEDFLGQASADMSVEQFALLCGYYLAALQDGHTSLSPFPNEARLPLAFHWNLDGLFFAPDSPHRFDGHVTTIGKIDLELLGETIDTYTSSENEAGRYYNRSMYAGLRKYHMAAGLALRDDMDIHCENNVGSGSLLVLDYDTSSTSTQRNSFEFTLLEDGSIAYMVANLCTKDDSWEAANALLAQAINNGVRKVIIDISANPGGDSSVWDAIFTALGFQGYPATFGSIRRHSELAKSTTLRGLSLTGESSYNEPQNPTIDMEAYSIDLVVIVSERTFSSAMFFAGAVRDAEVGTIIGRVPGNNVSHFGYPAQFTIPHSRLQGGVSTHYWMRPNPQNGSGALMLDREVPFGEEALAVAVAMLQETP